MCAIGLWPRAGSRDSRVQSKIRLLVQRFMSRPQYENQTTGRLEY